MIKIAAIVNIPELIELFKKTFKEHNDNAYSPEYEKEEYEMEAFIAKGAR